MKIFVQTNQKKRVKGTNEDELCCSWRLTVNILFSFILIQHRLQVLLTYSLHKSQLGASPEDNTETANMVSSIKSAKQTVLLKYANN